MAVVPEMGPGSETARSTATPTLRCRVCGFTIGPFVQTRTSRVWQDNLQFPARDVAQIKQPPLRIAARAAQTSTVASPRAKEPCRFRASGR